MRSSGYFKIVQMRTFLASISAYITFFLPADGLGLCRRSEAGYTERDKETR